MSVCFGHDAWLFFVLGRDDPQKSHWDSPMGTNQPINQRINQRRFPSWCWTLRLANENEPTNQPTNQPTQVPQLVLDEMVENGEGAAANVIVTQPRRISAVGVAERIAAEKIEGIGETVGWAKVFNFDLQ